MLKLYTAGRSGNAHKVRLALNLMKVPYEEVEMSFEDGSIKAADFLAKNPRGQVPAIEDGDEARRVYDESPQLERDKDADRLGRAVIIDVDRVIARGAVVMER